MDTPLKILFAEDISLHFEYARLAIKAEDIPFESVCVDTEADFKKQLGAFAPDIVVSDYEMPRFDGRKALEITKKHNRFLPFIMLTGSDNEEIALACMRAGADDYVLKDKIKRLPFAIREAMIRVKALHEKEQITHALRQSEHKYRMLAVKSADIIFTLDLNLNYTFVSDAIERITGEKPEDYKKRNVIESMTEESRKAVAQLFQEEMALEASGTADPDRSRMIELTEYHPKGHLLYFESSLSFMRDEKGNPIGIMGVSRDITDRKLAEQKLEASEKRHKTLISEMIQGLAQHEIIQDKNGKVVDYRFLDVNPAFEKLTGLKAKYILGKTVLEVLPKTENYWIENYGKVALTGEHMVFEEYSREIGKYFEVMAYRNQKNQFVTIFHDVTDKHLAEEARKASEKQYRMLAENSADVIFIMDLELNFTYVSPAIERITGFSVKETLKRKVFDSFTDESKQQVINLLQKELELEKQGQAEPNRTRIIQVQEYHKEGHLIHVESSLSFLRDQSGQATGIMGVTRDITDKVKAEESLRQASLIIKNSPVVAILWENTAEKPTLYISENCEILFGYPAESFLSGEINFRNLVHPDDVERVATEVAENKNKPNTKSFSHVPYRIIRADGEVIWVQDVTTIIRNESGAITHMQGIISDITERTEAELAAEQSHEMLSKLANQVPGVVYQYQLWPNGHSAFIYASEGMWLIYEFHPQDLIQDASPVFERLHPEDREYIYQSILESAEKQSIYEQEFRVVLPEQGLRWRYCHARPEKMPDGSTLWHGIIMDITDRKEAERAQRKSEAQYRQVFENAPIGLLNFDQDGIIVNCNQNFIDIIGSSAEKLIGLDMTKLPNENVHAAITHALAGHKASWEGRYSSVTADKSTEVNLQLVPVMDDQKKLIGGIGIVHDITERIESERKIRQSEERFRLVYENSPIGIINFDATGKVVDCNRQFLDIIGSTPEKVFGLDLTKLPNKQVVHAVQSSLAGKRAIFEGKYVPVTGSRSAELRMHFSPLRDEVETILGGVGIIEDITERKQNEEKLRQSDRIFTHAMDMLCIAGFDGYFKILNPAWSKVLGYTTEELLAKPWISFVHPDDVEATENAGPTLIDGKEVYQFTNRYICKDGSVKWLAWNSFPYKEEGVMFGAVRDVTKQIEDRKILEESEKRFAKTFYASPISLAIARKSDGSIQDVNDAFCRLSGFTKEAILHKTPIELKLTSKQAFIQALKTLDNNGHFINEEMYFKNRQGEEKIILLSLEPFEIKGEEHLLASFIDITDRKMYEAELTKLTRAVEQSPVSIVITNLEGTIEYINPKVCEITGYKAKELIGQNPRVLNSGEKPESEYREMYDTLARGETWQGEFHNKKKNGELYWESASISPVINDLGEMTHYIAVKEDITDWKKLRNELIASEERYRDMCESNPLPMWIYDVDTLAFVEVNQAAVHKYGYTEAEFLSMTLKDIRPPEDIPHLLENVATVHDHYQKSDQWRHLTKDGKQLEVEINSHTVISPEGYNRRMVLINDVTEREATARAMQQAKEMAEASSRLKTNFLNNISHEVRTPLNGILGVMSLLSDPEMDAEERESLNEIVNISSQRLMQTITDYMDISLITAGNMEKSLKTVPVVPVIEKLHNKFEHAISSKGLAFDLQMPEQADRHFVHTDQELLEKVMIHLLSNAEKFTDKGKITLGYLITETGMQFFVKDTGKGIKKEYQKRVFEIFSQEEEGNVRKFEGSGLGLAIIKGIAGLLEARLSFESVPGQGSAFYFTLPQAASVSAEKDKTTKKGASLNEQPLVLIAEDDESNFQVMDMIVRKQTKARVLWAQNGQEAVDLFAQNPQLDLILMDLKMPVKDGFLATQEIRKADKKIPIIAITAYAMSGDEKRALDAGCDDYLAKPVTLKVLMNKLEEYGLKRK